MIEAKQHLVNAYQAVTDKKGAAIRLIDVRAVSSFTDFFLICNGNNRKQNQAICDEVRRRLKNQRLTPAHVEGYDHAEWILLDYIDVIVHIFSENAREFYKLEKLWSDGILVEPQALSA